MTADVRPTRKSGGSLVYILPILLIVLVAAVLVVWNSRQAATPADDSAEAGFARDMIVHHAQAVEMARLLYDRTDNETLRSIAYDMMMGQQAQIGQMQGWLDLWGLSYANPDLPMTWMGTPVEGLMPGLATDEQLDALREASGTDADAQFIALMVPHHQSGVHMGQAILERTTLEPVRVLAQSIITAQEREITELERIAADMGAVPPTAESTPEHHH